MTISSSLNAGVAGLNVNATRLATIADNISNSGTLGYRRAISDFHAMVTSGQGIYSAGGVRSTVFRQIDQGGSIVGSTNPTDISVGGRGFIPVTALAKAGTGDSGEDLRLATTGSFRANEDGFLATESGLVLMGWPANTDGTIPTYPRDSDQGLEPIQISNNQFAGNPTSTMTIGLNIPATETLAGASGEAFELSVEYYGNLGTSESLNMTFTPTVPATGASNEWTMTVEDTASGGAIVGEFTITFDDSRANGGTIASVTPITGGPYDPVTGELSMAVGGGPFTLDIGAVGDSDGITQLSDNFSPVSIQKDGSPSGNLTSVEIDENGNLYALYDVGVSRLIYQVPLVDVPNPNGLESLSSQTYRIAPDSGDFFLWQAGTGPTGTIIGYSREESTTDVAAELTQLIQTQRAYSSNAKVIQTVDEMLQETTNIKR